MPRSSYEMGLCDVCECGFIQERHLTETIQDRVIFIDEMYCLKCGKTWKETEWTELKENSREREYHENTDVENLRRFNIE